MSTIVQKHSEIGTNNAYHGYFNVEASKDIRKMVYENF